MPEGEGAEMEGWRLD